MSFILDALRKSEHARQKQSGPGLAEVPVVAARPKTNVWATAAVALLVVNLLAVGVLLLRRAGEQSPPAVAGTSVAPRATPVEAVQTPVAPAVPPAAMSAPNAGPTLAPAATTNAAPGPAGAPPRPAESRGRNPLAEEVTGDGDPGVDPSLAASAAAVPRGPPAVARRPATTPTRPGTVVYAPLPEAADLPYDPEPAPGAAAPAGGLPTADEVTARGGLPALHLDLHVYATAPQQRFIFVNSRKYREGEALQEGPTVEQITPQGAVLSHRGSRFLLSND